MATQPAEYLDMQDEHTEALALRQPAQLSAIMPVMDLEVAKQRLIQFQQFVKEYLVDGEDFGTIPGTPKPTLLKPGADKLCELYGLTDEYEVTERTEDWDRGLFDYEIRCRLKRGDRLVSTGMGSCNSYEGKYRWRDAQRRCPQCSKETIIKGKEEYGGGWICFTKKGGCGAKFADIDNAITGQQVGKVQNEDIATLKNTILKMAKKRAKIDATLAATRSSGIFTQDIEDLPEFNGAPEPTRKQPSNANGKVTPPASSPVAATCQLCHREVKGLRVPKRGGGTEDVPPERIIEAGKKAYNGAVVCGHCQGEIKTGKRQAPAAATVNADSFTATKFEKDQDGSVIATGLVRSCSVTEGAKPRLIVKFDDDQEVYSWHTGDTRRLIEKYCIGKTCEFLCTDSKFGLAFSNVMTIDGQDADAVQLAGEIVP